MDSTNTTQNSVKPFPKDPPRRLRYHSAMQQRCKPSTDPSSDCATVEGLRDGRYQCYFGQGASKGTHPELHVVALLDPNSIKTYTNLDGDSKYTFAQGEVWTISPDDGGHSIVRQKCNDLLVSINPTPTASDADAEEQEKDGQTMTDEIFSLLSECAKTYRTSNPKPNSQASHTLTDLRMKLTKADNVAFVMDMSGNPILARSVDITGERLADPTVFDECTRYQAIKLTPLECGPVYTPIGGPDVASLSESEASVDSAGSENDSH